MNPESRASIPSVSLVLSCGNALDDPQGGSRPNCRHGSASGPARLPGQAQGSTPDEQQPPDRRPPWPPAARPAPAVTLAAGERWLLQPPPPLAPAATHPRRALSSSRTDAACSGPPMTLRGQPERQPCSDRPAKDPPSAARTQSRPKRSAASTTSSPARGLRCRERGRISQGSWRYLAGGSMNPSL
jgi:hypothetical protein